MRKVDKALMQTVQEFVQAYGYQEAIKELCKKGVCASKPEAKRLVKFAKIKNGDKKVRYG